MQKVVSQKGGHSGKIWPTTEDSLIGLESCKVMFDCNIWSSPLMLKVRMIVITNKSGSCISPAELLCSEHCTHKTQSVRSHIAVLLTSVQPQHSSPLSVVLTLV